MTARWGHQEHLGLTSHSTTVIARVPFFPLLLQIHTLLLKACAGLKFQFPSMATKTFATEPQKIILYQHLKFLRYEMPREAGIRVLIEINSMHIISSLYQY